MRMSEPTRACDAEGLEQYVAGRLAEPDRDLIEHHLLECEACAGEVQLLAGVRDELRPASRVPRAWAAAVAAGLVVAVGAGVMWMRQTAPSAPGPAASMPAVATETPAQSPGAPPDLDLLAKFSPPPYVLLRTRTGESAAPRPFEAAMDIYNAGRYDEAARALASVIQGDPDHDAASLFFGISSLAAGRPVDGIAPLARVAGREGPYVGLARLMLARAYLATREVEKARRELEQLAASSETQAADARAILKALPAR